MPNHAIGKSQSLYLDLLRGLAALAVVFHHYNNHIARSNHRVFPDVGKEAVMVFFVLSGFVIAMVVEERERKFTVFAAKRMARFYSVTVPVTFLLIVIYFISKILDFTSFDNWGDLNNWPMKVLATLTFTTDTLFWQRVYLPGAKPMWSLSYEFWYYFIFGFSFLFSRRLIGIGIAFAIALLLGVPALLLMPVWLLGVLAFQIVKIYSISYIFAWIYAVSGLGGLVALQISGLRDSLLNTVVLFHCQMADATWFPYYYCVGFCILLNLLGTLKLLEGDHVITPKLLSLSIHHVAHTSFFLYLTHMPVMLLLKAWFGGLVFPFFIPAMACVFAMVVGRPIESLRFPLQRWLLRKAKKLN